MHEEHFEKDSIKEVALKLKKKFTLTPARLGCYEMNIYVSMSQAQVSHIRKCFNFFPHFVPFFIYFMNVKVQTPNLLKWNDTNFIKPSSPSSSYSHQHLWRCSISILHLTLTVFSRYANGMGVMIRIPHFPISTLHVYKGLLNFPIKMYLI